MSISHFYVPAPDQADAQARADALGVTLVSTDLASEPRYVDRITSLPCVVCDHGDRIIFLPEPVTLEQLEAAHDLLLEENVPTTVARTADQVVATAEAIAAHTAAANNPHGITPAAIGAATPADIDTRIAQVVGTAPVALDTLNELASALGNDANFASTVTTALAGKAPTGHNHDAAYAPTHSHPYAATSHAHVDADLPAGLARDSEVTAAVSAHAATSHGTIDHAALTNLTTGNPHTQYSQTSHTHSYAATSHAHVDADLPAGLARDAEVAAGYSPLGHVHGAAAPAAHAASHATAAADPITPAAIGAAASGHTHTLVDADIPAAIARDAEVAAGYSALGHTHSYEASGAVATHAAATDPHPTYLTQAEGDGRYRQSATALVDADIPAAIARDTEVTAAVTAHEAAADPHSLYLTAAEGAAAYAPIGAATGGALRVANAQTATATAATAVTGMSFAIPANATIVFQMHLSITTSTGTAPTTTWGFTGPASPTAVAIVAEIDTSTSVETSAAITSFTTFAAGAQVAATGAKFHGVIQNGGTAGTVQLTVARGGTTPSMVIAAGSNGFWLRVA